MKSWALVTLAAVMSCATYARAQGEHVVANREAVCTPGMRPGRRACDLYQRAGHGGRDLA